MKNKIGILLGLFVLVGTSPIFGQMNLDEFIQPVGNWELAGKVQMDAAKPEMLKFEAGKNCVVNGKSGKAKYLVTKKEYDNFELHVEFMLPKGSNSGIYFMCRYEIQLFDSWGASDLTFYDCGGIQQGMYNRNSGKEIGFDGYAPKINACKAPGEWQSLDVVFMAPKFNEKGEKIKNAQFEKVVLNGKTIHEKVELPGPTKGALSEKEVPKAPFRLQGGHGPVAFRNLKTKDLN